MRKVYKYLCLLLAVTAFLSSSLQIVSHAVEDEKTFIKWVDLNATAGIMRKVLELDIKYHNTETEFKFVEAMAYLALKNGNSFSDKKDSKNLQALLEAVKSGTKISQMYPDNKYYKYYVEAFGAVFDGLIGEYKTFEGGETQYGMRGYFPLAEGFWFNHYDDFGSSRSYGFKRKHLGHDIMGAVGTPIIAVEGGTIAEIGWNQYGGWRIGIRSHDTKRYYYYAHMRKDHPYAADFKIGDSITAGQVIGYLGNTGYSSKENVNLKSGKPHLHFGLQLIFDESQVKGNNEIWVDVYTLCNLLSRYRAKTQKNPDTKESYSLSQKIAIY